MYVGNDIGFEASDPLAGLLDGRDDDIIPEDQLPFMRMKLVDDHAEDEPATVRTGSYIETSCDDVANPACQNLRGS